LGDFARDVTFGGMPGCICFTNTTQKLIITSEIQTIVKDCSLAMDMTPNLWGDLLAA
jgi:hypothetical protein